MEEFVYQLDNLMEKLDSWDIVCHLKELNETIHGDLELQELLKEYSNQPSDELKNKILMNPLFLEYKEYETELNLFIMSFNKKLKEITNKGGCL